MNVKYIRNNSDLVRQNICNRFQNPNILDKILFIDDRLKNIIKKLETYRHKKNILSKYYKKYMVNNNINNNDITDTADIKLIIQNLYKNMNIDIDKETFFKINALIDTKITSNNEKKINLEKMMNDTIKKVGNILLKEANINASEENNIIVFSTNLMPKYPLSHIDLFDKYNLVEYDEGIKIAGNRGYFFKGFMVKLNMALMQYACDFLEKEQYILMDTPQFINSDIMDKICQLEDYEDTLYKLEGYDKYLIATSEQPLTGYFYNKHFNDPKELPIKYAGISTCFRKETGAHNKNTRGIFRVHQFTKVEQFCITDENSSSEMFNTMINLSSKFYESLGLNYRIVNIASGALNNSAAVKYDLEGWFPGSNSYFELVSCTNTTNYFSDRINCTYGLQKKMVHMLNCTLCANTRTLCCIIETFQTENGFKIPDVLVPYLHINEYIHK